MGVLELWWWPLLALILLPGLLVYLGLHVVERGSSSLLGTVP